MCSRTMGHTNTSGEGVLENCASYKHIRWKCARELWVIQSRQVKVCSRTVRHISTSGENVLENCDSGQRKCLSWDTLQWLLPMWIDQWYVKANHNFSACISHEVPVGCELLISASGSRALLTSFDINTTYSVTSITFIDRSYSDAYNDVTAIAIV